MLRNGKLKRQTDRSRMPEKAAAAVRSAPTPRVRDRDEEGQRTFRAFTVRLPVELYDRLQKEAVYEERSMSAQTQVNLQEFYQALDAIS
jgi:hypothetical protein